MILKTKYSLVLIYLLFFLVFTRLGSNNNTLAKTSEYQDDGSTTDLSLVEQVTENLNLADNLTLMQWSTYLGGSSDDLGYSVATDSLDSIIVVGHTHSANFTVLNGYDETFNGGDGFVTKYNSSGDLLWSTFLGGTSTDRVTSVAIDSQDNIIVTGYTSSTDFPVLNGYDETHNGGYDFFDVFVTKFTSSGDLFWSTFLGGSKGDTGVSVVIDTEDAIIITGYTRSFDFPFLNGYDMIHKGLRDCFVTKFASSGDLLWSTFLGGSKGDTGVSVAVDSQDNIVVTGYTTSTDFPVLNGYNETHNDIDGAYYNDAFISKFNSSGDLLWSTFLGGSEEDVGESVVIDSLDSIIVAGSTESNDFPMLNGYNETYNGGWIDIFVTKFTATGSLVWSTYLGGSSMDIAFSVAIDSHDNLIVTGETSSRDFPVLNSFYETHNGGESDTLITKFDSYGNLVWSTYFGGTGEDWGCFIAIDSQDSLVVIGFTSSTDFPVLNGYDETYNGAYFGGDVSITKFLNPATGYDTDNTDDENSSNTDDEIASIGSFLLTLSSFTLLMAIYKRKKPA